jgi:hypothetical protein
MLLACMEISLHISKFTVICVIVVADLYTAEMFRSILTPSCVNRGIEFDGNERYFNLLMKLFDPR